MFGKKKAPRKPRREGSNNAAQFGFMGLDGGLGEGSDGDDDAALEEELKQMMYGGSKTKKLLPKRSAPKVDLDSMVAACMKDDPSGDEPSDDDDTDLLGELEGLNSDDDDDVIVSAASKPSTAVPQNIKPLGHSNTCDTSCPGVDLLVLIDSRIANYSQAERQAKQTGEGARVRRFARGLASLTDLRRKAANGETINEDDIPPQVMLAPATLPEKVLTPPSENITTVGEATVAKLSAPKVPEKSPSLSANIANISLLQKRREECKSVALQAKHDGDKAKAVAGLRAVKECDSLIAQLSAGEITAVEKLPEITLDQGQLLAKVEQPTTSPPKIAVATRQFSRDDPIQMPDNPEDIPPLDPSFFGAPPPPNSVAEALQQRLAKYQQDEQKAKEEGNDARVRRLGRIVRQYTDAIRLHKAGKAVQFEELPTPPGFAPIPVTLTFPKPSAAAAAVESPPQVEKSGSKEDASSPAGASARPTAVKPPAATTARDKQLAQLEKMQAQFKQAALEAKKAGEMDEAKEYLRHCKGFDKVIEAAKCGYPVDFKTLPVPPRNRSGASMDFEIVRKEDCIPSELIGDRHEMYSKLEGDLVAQVKMCMRNSDHFKSTGDVGSANKFQQMSEHTKKDLDTLRFAFKRGELVPKFHYEIRSFSKNVCNSDLNDVDLEFSVIGGINFVVPNARDVLTYCKLEFPFPKENPFRDRTAVVKDATSPQYNHSVIVPVNPKDKYYQRVFKRQAAKVEVWTKGGFLRSDSLIGTALIKLQALETVCEIHDSFPLMDGRRAVGGKIEVKFRVRNPIVAKQVEKVEEKWLVITYK